MKARREPLQPAHLTLDAQGVPCSTLYGDVYHSRSGAFDQARHVFLRGNDLPQRWQGRDTFTVCETGFGLGNNFLALWQAWRECGARPQRLHVLSFEAHPFTAADLARALAGHEGEMAGLAQALVDAWPPLIAGLHRLEFEGGRVTLTLAFGRIEYLARQTEARVDAFFLDGFSPRVNPQMWSRELFGQLVRMANEGATAATWCSAGQVRRDLAAAGFLVTRVPGFGGKRQMSRAVLRPGLGRPAPRPQREPVIVVGGGLAGTGVAHSLALRGHAVAVFDPMFRSGPGGSHEGHRSAAMTPALSRDDNPMSRLSRAGILLAHQRWKGLHDAYVRCGSLLRVPESESGLWRAALRELAQPAEWARWCEAHETEAQVGHALRHAGVWLGAGSRVRPAALIAILLAHEGITVQPRAVASIRAGGTGWQVLGDDAAVLGEAPRIVLATATHTPALLAALFPDAHYPRLSAMQRMGGQVAFFRAGDLPCTHAIVAGAGYWLPEDGGIHTGGSTYVFDTAVSEPTESGFDSVAHKVAGLLEIDAARLRAARAQPSGWAGWRVAFSDHLPMIGAVDARESVWLACGYGSRGLSWMTLAGEIIAARLNGEPQVVERELLKSVRAR